MGDKLKKLAVYNNVRLHPQIVPPVLDKLKKSTNLYLDINHGSADENFLKSLQEQEKTLPGYRTIGLLGWTVAKCCFSSCCLDSYGAKII
ncbi:glycosyltransferase [Streptococcus pneumoniae]|nr:glycosyltransferase [Streptococcus pneumoniae]